MPPPLVETREQAVQCLSSAIAYEAGHEPTAGQQAVAEVILNRVRIPGFPKTVCGVVYAGSTRRTGCQFTFTCDGSLRRPLSPSMIAATRAVAEAALDGRSPVNARGATHYHADYVSPYWAPSLIRVVKIGAHIFYRGPTGPDPTGQPYRLPGADSTNAGEIASTVQPVDAPHGFAPWGLAMTTPAR